MSAPVTGSTISSLKTARKLSPTPSITPLKVVLGAGVVGMGTIVSSPSTSGSPSETTSVPPVIVVEPVVPDSDAVHVLEICVAVNTSWPEVLMGPRVAVVVTDPAGPVAPVVLRAIGPEVKRMAGP